MLVSYILLEKLNLVFCGGNLPRKNRITLNHPRTGVGGLPPLVYTNESVVRIKEREAFVSYPKYLI